MLPIVFLIALGGVGLAQPPVPLCGGVKGCSEEGRHDAGTDSEGRTLTVVELTYELVGPEELEGKCVPANRFILIRARAGRTLDTREVLTICQSPPSDRWESKVGIKANRIEIERNGGAFAGIFTQVYGLSPWRARSFDYCDADGNGDWRSEVWDWTSMTGRFYSGTAPDQSPCSHTSVTLGNFITPAVAADIDAMEKNKDGLGSCAMPMTASGKQGFVKVGRPDPKDPMEVRALRGAERTLLVQVSGPSSTSKSWMATDRISLWAGSGRGAQYLLPLIDAPVSIAAGTGKPLLVRRWNRPMPAGRTAVVLRIELPPSGMFSDGFTLEYQERSAGRVIATNRFKGGSAYERQKTGVDNDSAGLHVRCQVVGGLLEVTGPQAPSLQMWDGPLGRPPEQAQ